MTKSETGRLLTIGVCVSVGTGDPFASPCVGSRTPQSTTAGVPAPPMRVENGSLEAAIAEPGATTVRPADSRPIAQMADRKRRLIPVDSARGNHQPLLRVEYFQGA